jgi:hypothetical protein
MESLGAVHPSQRFRGLNTGGRCLLNNDNEDNKNKNTANDSEKTDENKDNDSDKKADPTAQRKRPKIA